MADCADNGNGPGAVELAKARLGRAVGGALRRRRPESGRTLWYTKVADACERHEDSVQNWVGDLAPDAASYWLLVDHFGMPFHLEVTEAMTGASFAKEPLDAADWSTLALAEVLAARLREQDS